MKRIILPVFAAALLVAGPAAAANIEVGQKGKSFNPGSVNAKVGDTLVFKNDDAIAHNVHSTKGMKFNLGLQKPGDTSELELDDAGKFTINCAIHPKMKMQVTVAD